MDRTDFVENRIDVIRNVYTLYSYAKSNNIEDKDWAIQRFKQGHWYVVEPFGDLLLFAPSRFVGYKDNTRAKHMENPGDGTHTNSKFYELKLYKEAMSDFLIQKFQSFMKGLGIEKNTAKFFIPYDLDLTDLECHHQCYFISPTHCEGQKEIAWKDFLNKGIMAIGWKDIDYSTESVKDIMQEYQGDADAQSAFSLIKQIKPGDIVCCTHNRYGLWGIGIAASSYKYEKGIHYAGIDDKGTEWNYSHYVDVAWLCYNKSGFIAISDLQIQPSEKQWSPYGTLSQREIPQYIKRYIFRDMKTKESSNHYTELIGLLKANKNLILTGAPGTGKTFLAREIAHAMGAEVEFVQFHPSYDYTDFVEGLRPTPPDQNGNIGFERKDGVFKTFCRKAIQGELKQQFIKKSADIPKQVNDEDNRIAKAMQWLMEQNGAIIKSIRSETVYTLVINQNNIYLRIPKGNINYVNPKGVIKYLKTGEYDKLHQTYEPSVGSFIKSKCPLYAGKQVNSFQDENSLLVNASSANETTREQKDYVFIIDEINRGEISKIFGELFFSIDPGYRGKKGLVKTQYQNMITDKNDPFFEGFYVPDNVYIIGTMNDIDRSVESMDFAMRRRFAWKEIKANENTGMLDDLGALKTEVIEKMNRLNNKIWDETTNEGIEGLGTAYHIGGAYFRKLKLYLNEDYSNKKEAYQKLWENHLRIVLFEYLRGSVNITENMKELEEVYYAES